MRINNYLACARFGQGLRLCGYTAFSQWQPGAQVTVTLYGELTDETDRPLNSFVHLLGATENPETGNPLWGQADKVLNLHWWLPGLHQDTYTFQITPNAPAGEYWLEIGLWDPWTGNRIPPRVEDSGPVLSPWESLLVHKVMLP